MREGFQKQIADFAEELIHLALEATHQLNQEISVEKKGKFQVVRDEFLFLFSSVKFRFNIVE